jgi:aspartyl-tRNA(Asn)/glutamyl-tRNA(Gln) amidotransferase subunit C
MPISKEQIARVAELAGLKLTLEEQQKFSRELNRIIDYMKILEKIDTDSAETRGGMVAPGPIFRDDIIGESLSRGDVLRNAPEKRDSYFVVPRVI